MKTTVSEQKGPSPRMNRHEMAGSPASDDSVEDLSGYAYAVALVQFAVLALGLMTVTILTKVEGGENGLPAMANWLVSAGLWVLAVPLGWYLCAITVLEICPRKQARQIMDWTGGLLVVGILVIVLLSVL